MKVPTELQDRWGYRAASPVCMRGAMGSCWVQTPGGERIGEAEWLDAAATSEAFYVRARRQWRAYQDRQPQGSLPQLAFHESAERLIRVIAPPQGKAIQAWVFATSCGLQPSLRTALSLTGCLEAWHAAGQIHGWLSGDTLFQDDAGRVEMRDSWNFTLRSQEDFLALPVQEVAFLSPESSGSLSREISPASDLYSVGVLLFGMLAARMPIEAQDVSEYLDKQLCLEPPRLRALGIDVPPALDDVVARLLRRDPRDRYETAAGLRVDLERIVAAGHDPQRPVSFPIGMQDVRRQPTEASLVGREAALHRLQDAILRSAEGGRRCCLVTSAEPSSRRPVLEEVALRASARGMLVFRSSGSAQPQLRPLQAFEGLMETVDQRCAADPALADRIAAATRDHAATLIGLFPQLSRLWSAQASSSGPEAFGGQRAVFALQALVFAFAREAGGVAFLFDDLEQADTLTHSVIRGLFGEDAGDPEIRLLGVVTAASRDACSWSKDLLEIPLERVARGAVVQHLQSSAGIVSETICESILEVADGEVLVATAIFNRMIDKGVVKPTEQGWVADGSLVDALWGIESFAEMLERQIETLSPPVRHLLSTAAVLGHRFELATLAHVAKVSYEEVLEVATEALSRRLLWRESSGDAFHFVHDQIPQRLSAMLDLSTRQGLHREAAAYLEGAHCENVFDLAFHYDAAGEGPAALRYALAAARQARHRFALGVARDQFLIAARWVPHDAVATRREIAEGLGEIHLLAGRYEQASEAFQAAIPLARNRLEQARLQQHIGELAFKRGHFAEAAREYEKALSMTGIGVPSNVVTMLLGLGWQVAVQLGHSLLPVRWIARRPPPSELACLRMQALSRLSRVYWFSRHKLWTLGNHLRSLNEAERFAPSATLAAIYSEHGPVMSLLRWFRRANRYAERSLAIRRAQADRWGQGQSQHYHAVVLLAECRFEAAIETSQQAVELLRQTGDLWEMNMARYQEANALYRIGRLTEAAKLAEQMFTLGQEIGDRQATGISLDVWARAMPETLPLQVVDAQASVQRLDAQSHAQTALAHAVILLHHEQIDEAIATLQAAIRRCEQAGHLNTYISPCYAWLATAQRRRWAAIDPRNGMAVIRQRRRMRTAVGRALRIARGFPADRAHGLREAGIAASIAGQPRRARWQLQRSLAAARRYRQPLEELETLRVLQQLHADAQGVLGRFSAICRDRLNELETLRKEATANAAVAEPGITNLSLADRFVTVLKAGRRIAKALSPADVFREASESARRLLHGQAVDVVRIERRGATMRCQPSKAYPVNAAGRQRIARYEQEIVRAAELGRAVAPATPESSPTSSTGRSGGSVLAVPVLFRGECVAALLVSHQELSGLFGPDELRLADFVAILAGAALENADGFIRLQQLNETLEQRVEERTQAAEERARQLATSNQQLRATEEQLRQAILEANAANEAKSRFLATISHEIRTPLNGILGMTRLAQHAKSDARQIGYLETVQESGESLMTLINDLLDLSKLDADKVELERIPLDVRALGEELTRLMTASAWQKGLELECEIDPALPAMIFGDPARLRQIIINLLGNALKFTEEGFVRLQMRQTRGEAGDAWLAIEVCDSGIGIPEDKRGKVFESFSQVDSSTTRRYGGTGLGLAICRELAERMGGEISVDSTLGEGSTFRVVLPLEPVAGERASRDEASPQPAATVPASPPPAATPSARVLVVEDGMINQEVIVGVLEMSGHKTEVANDGAEAVERTREATFDICFMDVDMPKMDGIEATQLIRREMTARGQTHLPIVAMTAHSGEAIEAKCRDAGMDAHLSKPIQPAALAEMIARFTVSV